MKIYSRYSRPDSPSKSFKEPSETQQHFRDECDVNRILEKYLRLGVWTTDPKQVPRQPRFEDFSLYPGDLRSAQDLIIEAERNFAALPASVRARFGNDPYRLLDFVHDPANRSEAEKLGICRPAVNDDKPKNNDTSSAGNPS